MLRAQFAAVAGRPALELPLITFLSPMTRPVVEPVLRGVAPRVEEVLTPAEARERYGVATPREQYVELREREELKLAA